MASALELWHHEDAPLICDHSAIRAASGAGYCWRNRGHPPFESRSQADLSAGRRREPATRPRPPPRDKGPLGSRVKWR